jgi:predicted TIM-barrel fold metal-dependent hydrolase
MIHNLKLADMNGVVGHATHGVSDFPRVVDRLQHMDRLGISQALVWKAEAAQNHALTSNQNLIAEIESCAEARDRIIPELVISGNILYERSGLETLENQLRRGRTRALRFVNALGTISLRQVEPVVQALAPHTPFLIMRSTDAPAAEILDFTGALPETPLVLTEVGWTQFSTVLDLMRRRKNILIETSWLCINGAMELLVRQFGAERVVFGTGYRSHQGAAIAEIFRANLSERERDLVAHGNFKLLTASTLAGSPDPSFVNRSAFWQNCLSGKKIGVEIIDAHGHVGPNAGFVLEDQNEQDQARLALRQMDSLGISSMVVSGLQALFGDPVAGNDLVARVLEPHGDRFKGYVVFHPGHGKTLTQNFERWFAGDFFVGFKILCSYWRVPCTDRRFQPMWEYANQHRLPVLMHTWSDPFNSPAMFRDLLKEYPDVSFLFGHSGGVDAGRREMEELAAEHPNAYMEWCGSFCSTILWEETLRKVPPGQIVFGSDTAPHSLVWELGRLLSIDVPDPVIEPILGANMRRILGRRI